VSGDSEKIMAWTRNLLISFGAYWVSVQAVVPLSWLFAKAKPETLYGDSVLAAISLGVANGMARAICAGLGAALVAFCGIGERPHRWASVVALLYIVAARPHYHFVRPATSWYRIAQTVDVIWPAIVCLAVAAIIGWKRRNRTSQNTAVEVSS
jgi:hypothetical protein